MHPIIFQYANEHKGREWCRGTKDVRGAGHAGGLRGA